MGEPDIQTDKVKTQRHGTVTWVNVTNADSEAFSMLEREYHLHPLHLTESVQKIQHTEVESENDYLFLVLHYPVFAAHTDKIHVGQVGVFLGKDYLVTVHTNTSPFIDDLFTGCQHNQDQADKNFGPGSSYLLYVLISRLLGNIGSMADIVEGELDDIEGLVFENTQSDALRIGRVRQKIIRLRRLIGPKRALLQDLAEEVASSAGSEAALYHETNVKTVNKLWEVVEEAKETIEIYKDSDFTTSTEQTNRILAILTLVFTFTIPITVMGTLYGMNVDLPGGIEAGPWKFLGTYTTFGLVIVFSMALAFGMYIYFKKKRWF